MLERSAFGGEVVMAVRHRELPAEGVQFHPESVLTEQGHELLSNFLTARDDCWPDDQRAAWPWGERRP